MAVRFEYLKHPSDDIAEKFAALTNRVMAKDHSIGFLEDLTRADAFRWIQNNASGGRRWLLLAWDKGKLVGCGAVCPTHYDTTKNHYAEIYKVMVDPGKQGKWLGKEIMHALEEKAREDGFAYVLLDTWDSPRILSFYLCCGYKVAGIIPNFVLYKGTHHDSYLFWKKL